MNTVYRIYFIHLLLSLIFILPQSFTYADGTKEHPSSPEYYSLKIVSAYPHDTQAFTQGLLYHDGFIYESTGIRGRSTLRKIKLISGKAEKIVKLPDQYFGEGITIVGNRIIQLTWRSHTGFIYNRNDLKLIGQFNYPTEGWGITYDGKSLIVSDGTNSLYFLDPETFKETRRLSVHDSGKAVTQLNELEYIGNAIYANVWHTDRIAIISPDTGSVTGWVDLERLACISGGDSKVRTLNGIAYDNNNDRLFVTGKLWPVIYEIKLVPADTENDK